MLENAKHFRHVMKQKSNGEGKMNGTNGASVVIDGRTYQPEMILPISKDNRLVRIVKQETGEMPNTTDVVRYFRIDGKGVYILSTQRDGQVVEGIGVATSLHSGIRLAYRNAYRRTHSEEFPSCIYGA